MPSSARAGVSLTRRGGGQENRRRVPGLRSREGAAVLRLGPHTIADDLGGLRVDVDRPVEPGRLLDSGPPASRAAQDGTFHRNVAADSQLGEVFENNHCACSSSHPALSFLLRKNKASGSERVRRVFRRQRNEERVRVPRISPAAKSDEGKVKTLRYREDAEEREISGNAFSVAASRASGPTGAPVACFIQRSGAMFPIFAIRSNSGPMWPAFSICRSI